MYPDLSLAIFQSLKKAVLVSGGEVSEVDVSQQRLKDVGCILTNLSQKEIDATAADDDDKEKMLTSYSLIVNPVSLLKEYGLGTSNKECSSHQDTLLSILQAYKSALFRLRYNLQPPIRGIRSGLVKKINERTMAAPFFDAKCESIDPRKLSILPHGWVETGRRLKEGEYIRTVHFDRSLFNYYLLNQELPVGIWEAGDPSLSHDIISNSSFGDGRAYVALGSHVHVEQQSFLSSCITGSGREIYLPNELVSLRDEGAKFVLDNWWSGKLLMPRSPYESFNELSLADSLIMEMIYRSWRSQGLVGYWLAATERLIIHGVADLLSEDMSVLGYGSGKVAIATSEHEDKVNKQDSVLLRYKDDCHLRIPIDNSWNVEKLCKMLPQLSNMQRIAACRPASLGEIDRAIDLQDAKAIGNAHEAAKKSLEEKFV